MWDELDPRSTDSRGRDPSDPRDARPSDPRDVFTSGLDLPRGLERERVHVHAHEYDLRESEVRTLATIGAFRVVPLSDLHDGRGRAADLWHGDLDRLRSAGLIQVVAPMGDEQRTPVLTLTQRGRELLESHRTRDHEPAQAFYVLARWMFLRDTGRKLTHVDQQLIASEGVHQDVPVEHWSAKW